MSNYVILIGRIVNELTIDSDTKNCEITIAISRAFKNEDGIYETDFIPVTLKGNIAKNVVEYCKKGDIVAIKGRIARTNKPMRILNDDEFTIINEPMQIIADKVTFLSSKN